MKNGQQQITKAAADTGITRSVPDGHELRKATAIRDADRFKSQHETFATVYREAEKSYDSTLLYLTGGALALSMTFLREVSKGPTVSQSYLVWSWVALTAALVLLLINQRLSALLNFKCLEILENQFRDYDPDKNPWPAINAAQKAATVGFTSQKCNVAVNGRTLIEIFNISGLMLFVVGITCMGIFVHHNLH